MEPAWMRKISNPMICNFFFGFYVFYAILFVLSLLFTIGLFTYSKGMGKTGIIMAFQALFTTAIGGVLMLFYYLICDRALIQKAVVDVNENFVTIGNTGSLSGVTAGTGSIRPPPRATISMAARR
jgi:hypothetical protein